MGLSGPVFGFTAVDNGVSGLHQRIIFGFFTLPAKVIRAAAGQIHSRLGYCRRCHSKASQDTGGATGLLQGAFASHMLVSSRDRAQVQVLPQTLLVLWQLLMPGVSFWGHLSGLLAGERFVRGD